MTNHFRPASACGRPDRWSVVLGAGALLVLAGLVGASCTGVTGVSSDAGSEPKGSGGTSAGSGTGGSGVATSAGGSDGGGNRGGSGAGGGATGSTGAGGTGTGSAGTNGSGGRTGAGGAGMGGRNGGVGGVTGAGGTIIVVPASCGSATHNGNPYGCNFGWGMENPGGSLTSFSYLQFMSFWIGSEAQANGTLNGCAGCSWLTSQVSKTTNLIPVFYAYIIGFYGHANGLPDGNVAPAGPNLTTGGANLIRTNRAKIIQMYASYAQQAHQAWGTRPLVWLLEGDFVQYTGTTQTNPLTYAELAQLAEDITCAIKANMPNAIVAINHSTWNADDVTNAYWAALNGVNYDMVWTSGVGNAGGFFATGTTASSYNGRTATYAYVHQITGRTIYVDTSFGLSAAGDSWSNAGAANVNARIADGVIGVNVTQPASGYAAAISSLGTLATTCH